MARFNRIIVGSGMALVLLGLQVTQAQTVPLISSDRAINNGESQSLLEQLHAIHQELDNLKAQDAQQASEIEHLQDQITGHGTAINAVADSLNSHITSEVKRVNSLEVDVGNLGTSQTSLLKAFSGHHHSYCRTMIASPPSPGASVMAGSVNTCVVTETLGPTD